MNKAVQQPNKSVQKPKKSVQKAKRIVPKAKKAQIEGEFCHQPGWVQKIVFSKWHPKGCKYFCEYFFSPDKQKFNSLQRPFSSNVKLANVKWRRRFDSDQAEDGRVS